MKFRKRIITSLVLSSVIVAPVSLMTVSCGNKGTVGKAVSAYEWTLSKINRAAIQSKTEYKEYSNSSDLEREINSKNAGLLIDDMEHLATLVKEGKIQKIDFEKILPTTKHNWNPKSPTATDELRVLVRSLYTKDAWDIMDKYNSWINQEISDKHDEFWMYVIPYSMSSQVITFDFKLLQNIDDYDKRIKGMDNKVWSPSEMATLRQGNQEDIKNMFKVLSYYLEREQDINSNGIVNWEDPDMDGDGIPNYRDRDENGDGILNIYDDIDYDGIKNWDDPDIDGDGIKNWKDPDMDGDLILNENDIDRDSDAIIDNDPSSPDYDSDFVWTGVETMDAQKLTTARILTVLRHRGYQNLLVDNNWRNNMYIGSERQRPDFLNYDETDEEGNIIEEDENAWRPTGQIGAHDPSTMEKIAISHIDKFNDITSYFIGDRTADIFYESTNDSSLTRLVDNQQVVDVALSDSTEAAMSLRAAEMTSLGYDDSIRYIIPDNPVYSLKGIAIPHYVKESQTSIYNTLIGDGQINSNTKGNILYGFDDKTTDGFIGRGHITYPAYASNFDYYKFTTPFTYFYDAIKNNRNDAFLQYDKFTWELMEKTSTSLASNNPNAVAKITDKNILFSIPNADVNRKVMNYYYKTIK